ncbi:hypothetical protein E3N88_22375 [Mikania micrantha]|uniref:Uncharacterized protein n=1 Tax=Mikania micrantha TaxID=192012 RepID=A0A5N6NAJ4_9ASTR|nr:hypothetical protein E3N88_22375 [Mikania micrantha]
MSDLVVPISQEEVDVAPVSVLKPKKVLSEPNTVLCELVEERKVDEVGVKEEVEEVGFNLMKIEEDKVPIEINDTSNVIVVKSMLVKGGEGGAGDLFSIDQRRWRRDSHWRKVLIV